MLLLMGLVVREMIIFQMTGWKFSPLYNRAEHFVFTHNKRIHDEQNNAKEIFRPQTN